MNIEFKPAALHLDLVAPSVKTLLFEADFAPYADEILVAEIDPQLAGGKDFCLHYGVSQDAGANCVIVEARRSDKSIFVACVALVGYQMDFNTVIRKTLSARRISLAPLKKVIEITQMENGSITPFGLPSEWPILIDSKILNSDRLVIGSGLLKSKLSVPTSLLSSLPNVKIIEGMASPA